MLRLMVVFAICITASPAITSECRIPDGAWQCEAGTCIAPDSAVFHGGVVAVRALIQYRGRYHDGKLIRDCYNGNTTSYGVEGLAEDIPIQAGFAKLCAQ